MTPPEKQTLKWIPIPLLCIIFLGCNDGRPHAEAQTAHPRAGAHVQEVSAADTARPALTPAYRWDQLRRDLEGSRQAQPVDAVLQSRAYRKFPKGMLNLELTDTGFVEYDPCNGNTPSIEVKDDTLAINFTLESMGYLIHHVEMKGADFLLRCTEDANAWLDVHVQSLRKPESAYRLSFQIDDVAHEWLVIPVEARRRFDFVTNPCPKDMVVEKTFKEIDFEQLE